jgi:hypothetical protein
MKEENHEQLRETDGQGETQAVEETQFSGAF